MKLVSLGDKLRHIVDMDKTDKEMVVIDAGSSYGEFIEGFHSMCGTGHHIFGFEPSKENRKILEQKFPHIVFSPKAIVGENTPKEVLFTEFVGEKGKYHQWGNIYAHGIERAKKDKALRSVNQYGIETTSLKRLIEFLRLDRIDYLKMDIEGSETSVIMTMTEVVAKRIDQISFELHNKKLFSKLMHKLGSVGYNIVMRYQDEIYATKSYT